MKESIMKVLILFIAPSVLCLPGKRCSVENEQCQMNGNNIVQTIPDINLEMCRVLCNDEVNCTDLTFFGPANFPFANLCVLFNKCNALDDCEDCLSEEKGCSLCSVNYAGSIGGENLIQIVEDIVKELECKNICENNESCLFYTHYEEFNDVTDNLCILLTGLSFPLLPCKQCHTGPSLCSQEKCQIAFLTIDSSAEWHESVLITEDQNVTVVSGESECSVDLKLVGVGGGGSGQYWGAGGGSGFVLVYNQSIVSNSVLSLAIGQGGGKLNETSSVITIGDGDTVLEIDAGGRGSSYDGGEGYSGGGAGCYTCGSASSGGNGGMDGSDGGASYTHEGGKGSHIRVGDLGVRDFLLTPGQGGSSSHLYGAGGGGVLVDGLGPKQEMKNVQGNGYGGGGGYYNGDYVDGLPGFIIIEIA